MDFIKFLIESALYPAMELAKGNKTRAYIRELKKTETLPRGELQELQNARLKRLLLHCVDNVPAYKAQAALRDEITRSPQSALLKFPPLTRASFKADPESFIAANADRASLIPNRTGGSTTGEPVSFYIDRVTVEHYEAARWRGLSWWGITPGSRSVMIWANPMDLSNSKKYSMKEKYMKNRVVISAYDIKADDMPRHAAFINSYKPEYIYGYATPLNAFAELMLKHGVKLTHAPKAVVSTSETLFPHYAENMSKAFGCPVVNEYGARDGGIIAYSAPCGHMHITSECAVYETLDPKTGQPVPNGETGTVAVTDLFNYSQPRVRYLLGDMAAISGEQCACGRGLPVMERIDGRFDDMFVAPDGKLFWSYVFTQMVKTYAPDAVAEYQVIQHSPISAEMKIVAAPNAPKEQLDRFISEARAMLKGSELDVQMVDAIPKSASGKTRYAIRKFDI